MALKTKFVSNKPRERSGSTSSSRFNFQKDWSLCQLIENHKKNSDYLILFDYHEDLVIVDSELNPSKVTFYQIKGDKTKNWTLERLIKSGVDKDGNPLLSIIGKLYHCKCQFDIETHSLNFVSNSRFNVKLSDNSSGVSKDKICISELSDTEKLKIKSKIKAELSLSKDPDLENITYLNVIALSLDDSAIHTKGILNDFFDQVKPDGSAPITAIYNHLFNEIKKLSDYDKEVSSFEELVEKKGISKSRFDKWLDVLLVNKDYKKIWERLEGLLQKEGVDYSTQRKLKSALTSYELKSKDPNNEILRRIAKQVVIIFDEYDNNDLFKGKNYLECLDSVFNKYQENPISQNIFNEIDIKAIIIAETYE